MPKAKKRRVESEISSSNSIPVQVDLDEFPAQTTEGRDGKTDQSQDVLVDDNENVGYNDKVKRERRKRLLFIWFIAVGTTVLLVLAATVPFLIEKRSAEMDTGTEGGVKKATADRELVMCEPITFSMATGYIVCNGRSANSTCWTVCIEGYRKDNDSVGDYVCQENGQWKGEAAKCIPKDCGIPYQNITVKEVELCPQPSGPCEIPTKDGVLNCSGTSYRHSCDVICNKQYRQTLSFIICESSGKWDSTDIGCLPDDPCMNNPCNSENGSCIPLSNKQQSLYFCTCNLGFAGNGIHCQIDSDLDGSPDFQLPCQGKHCQIDNCPLIPNSGQENHDSDQNGDACDFDDDNDNVNDTLDNCPLQSNPNQEDRDNDTVGDTCDNCISVCNTDQTDTDHDGVGNACETSGDVDNDGISSFDGDNCPLMPNPGQDDSDGDGVGNACDNCITIFNNQQIDADQNLIGDACDGEADQDSDGIGDSKDNCPAICNGDQLDSDADKLGDVCDSDKDGDGILDAQDNCPLVYNPDQEDKDGDNIGDACIDDVDGDMVLDYLDDYPLNKFLNRTDFRLYQEVLLDDEGNFQVPPKWKIFDDGQEIFQTANGNPGLMLSYTQFGHLDYTGTLFISDSLDDDFAGFVFGYQSNRHFYICSWKKKTQTYNLIGVPHPRSVARKGINLMVINSTTGPGINLRDALWETGNTMNQSQLLWHDPKLQWMTGVAYRWRLHDPDSGRIRIRFYDGQKLISDSGNIIDKRYRGGRVGMYVFSQEGVYYSALHAQYPKITDFALTFNTSEYANLGTISGILGQPSSLTLSTWVWITGANGHVICSLPTVDFGGRSPNLGFFQQSVDDEENWILTNRKTPTGGTGPNADHTSGVGFYAYFESSRISKGNRAFLETPWFATGKGCNMSFFYHMFDGANRDMGTLTVEVKTVELTWFAVFWRGGNQRNRWHQGNIDLSVYEGLIAVRFVAAKGYSYKSDIAIDDILFSPSCGESNACERPDVSSIFGTEDGMGVHLSVSDGKVQGGVSYEHTAKGNLSFVYNNWTHVALQYDSETKEQLLYVNGRIDRKVNNISFSLTSKHLLLGKNGAQNFQGQVDEVQIWNTAINVSHFYEKQLLGTEKGLIRYFKCNEREGNKLEDVSPLKLDGSLHGVQWVSSSLELTKHDGTSNLQSQT